MTPTAPDSSQIIKGLCELALLSLLKDRPHYGLEMLHILRTEAGIDLADGTIYPLLHRLAKAKLVQAEWRLDQDGARPRKYYALTSSGQRELAVQVEQWRKVSVALSAFLSRKHKS